MRLTLLGTGTSLGVPQVGCDCGVCHSMDPRDRRTRCAALLDTGSASLLFDTPPELRLQLLMSGTRRLDAVLFTHAHADHVAGIDDLRGLSPAPGAPLPCYGTGDTLASLRQGYRYIFDPDRQPIQGTSRPRLSLLPLTPGRPADIAGVPVLPLAFEHGHAVVLGFRVGPVAYITDAKRVPPEAIASLRGVELLVLNALWWRSHPTHLSIPEAIEVAGAIGARRTVLTHLTHETGQADLAAQLPPGIEPGYDGQILETSP